MSDRSANVGQERDCWTGARLSDRSANVGQERRGVGQQKLNVGRGVAQQNTLASPSCSLPFRFRIQSQHIM